MGQVCTICSRDDCYAIDDALRGGEPNRSVARRFGLSEGAIRRHLDNHLLSEAEEGPETDQGGPTTPADAASAPEAPEDARSAALRRLEAEEAASRAGRLAALEAEEQDRRDRERREQERAAALEAARAQADELAADRAALEDRIEEETGRLVRSLRDLEDLDGRHTRILSRAGLLRAGQQPVWRLVQRWLPTKLGRFAPGGGVTVAVDPYHGATLRERDPLAKTADARETSPPPTAA
jgi:hypothetical protein